LLPDVDRINNDTDFSWNIIRPKFFNGFQQSIAAFATSGLFLIIEHIVEYQSWLDDLVIKLNPFEVLYVGVKCPIKEIDKREVQRGDRQVGEGRSHIEDGVHTWSKYDLEVDTFINSPEENATLIIEFIEGKRSKENMFKKLYDKGGSLSRGDTFE